MGRPKSVYDWDGKRDRLYELYITENKSMDEVMAAYADGGFMPRYVNEDISTASHSPLTAFTTIHFIVNRAPCSLHVRSAANGPSKSNSKNGAFRPNTFHSPMAPISSSGRDYYGNATHHTSR